MNYQVIIKYKENIESELVTFQKPYLYDFDEYPTEEEIEGVLTSFYNTHGEVSYIHAEVVKIYILI